MASITSFNRFQLKNLTETPQRFSSSLNSSKSHVSFTDFATNKTEKRLLIPSEKQNVAKARSKVIARVDLNDEWGSDKDTASSTGVAVEEEEPKVDTEIENLKRQLVYTLNGTNRGLSATSETRAEIIELITQLEAKNSTPAPMEALTLFDGKWILAYTSFVGLFPLLSRGILPLVKVEEISQKIDATNFTVQNVVVFSGPLATTSISTNAKFEVRSPKRVQIKFEEGIIGTPQLTDSIELPESVEFLGQKFDLSPFKGLLNSVQGTASSVARSISSQPPLKFPISGSKAESWLLTTYLDEDLRISRGDGGSIFVLIKAYSPLLTT